MKGRLVLREFLGYGESETGGDHIRQSRQERGRRVSYMCAFQSDCPSGQADLIITNLDLRARHMTEYSLSAYSDRRILFTPLSCLLI